MMKWMRKLTAVLMVLVLLLGALAGCADNQQESTPTTTAPSAESATDPTADSTTESATDPSTVPAIMNQAGMSVDEMPENLKHEIEAIWHDHMDNPLRWYSPNYPVGAKYYGTYNGLHVVFTATNENDEADDLSVGNFQFYYSRGFDIWVFYDNAVRTIRQAYAIEDVTANDVEQIHDYHTVVYMEEQTNPVEPNAVEIAPLSEAELQEVNDAFVQQGVGSVTPEQYCGTFGECVVFCIENPIVSALNHEVVAGYYKFDTVWSNYYVYNNGMILQLAPAYDSGWLTDEQVGSIISIHYYRFW